MIRNLAVYKADESAWTEKEFKIISDTCGNIGINSFNYKDFKNKYIFDFGNNNVFMYPWANQRYRANFKNCTKIEYNDFLDKYVNKPQFPIKKKSTKSNLIVEFTDEHSGTIIDIDDNPYYELGYYADDWESCYSDYWKDIEEKEIYPTMTTTEFEILTVIEDTFNTNQDFIDYWNKLQHLGLIPSDTRKSNVGTSNYSEHIIQPWSIWLEYNLNAWDADIVKRVLRTKEGDSRIMDYEKIIHICEERIRQLDKNKS